MIGDFINSPRNQSQCIRTLLVDDQTLFVQALSELLSKAHGAISFEVIATAKTGFEAVALCKTLKPDLILMDCMMPEMRGADAVYAIKKVLPKLKIVMLSASDSVGEINRAIDAGADGYIMKRDALDELIEGVQRVMAGERVFDCLTSSDPISLAPQELGATLSRRELQVLKLLAEGHKSREISEILNRSLRTIENQRYSLLKKLDRPSPMELVSTARELGLLD